MNFVNQAVNVTQEAMADNLGLVVLALAVLAIAWGFWLVQSRPALKEHLITFVFALLSAVVGFFLLPSLVHSGLNDMVYWLDWAFHLVSIFMLFIYAYLVYLPIFSSMKK